MVEKQNIISYGIRRLILINSGMYAFSVFPIDCPLSICGTNNSGKSTAINALQLLFLTDMRDMDFGKHENRDTRKFYFPHTSSYVLAEIRLEHGHFVIGATGGGPASSYSIQHFAYRGQFDREDYRDNGMPLELDQCLLGLQRKGVECVKLQPQELRNMLLGMPGENAFDITLVPLRGHRTRYIEAWVSVFKNLLHMRNVNSQDLKKLLLSIFDIHLVAGDIDFAAEYQRVTEQVNRIVRELETLKKMRPHVRKILEMHKKRQEYRGKLNAGYDEIQKRLKSWFLEYKNMKEQDERELEEIEPRRKNLILAREDAQKEISQLSGEKAKCKEWLNNFEKEKREFQLIKDVGILEVDIQTMQAQRDDIVKKIGNSEGVKPAQIEQQIFEEKQSLCKIEQNLKDWDQNLWNLLFEKFTQEELIQVFTLLNKELLRLPVDIEGGITVDDRGKLDEAIQACLEDIKDGVYCGQGVVVPLKKLDPVDPARFTNISQLEEEKQKREKNIEKLTNQLENAQHIEALKEQSRSLSKKIEKKQEFRNRFQKHVQQCREVEGKRKAHRKLETKVEECNARINKLHQQERDLDRQAENLKNGLKERESERQSIEQNHDKILPLPPEEPPGDPAMQSHQWPESMVETMEEYLHYWESKQSIEGAIQEQLDFIESIGGGIYLHDDENFCIESLAEADETVPQREELLKKNQKTSIVELGSTLKGLRDNYRRLEQEITKFNRAINRRTISNLTKLEMRLEPNKEVLDAIEEIVKVGVERLFCDEQKASRAAEYLYKWVKSQGRKLNLTHLFELCFVVFTNEGKEIVYHNLENIESHGTTITIKALVNMHMMGHLIDEGRRGTIRFPYYLDEASSIDPRNQATLIEQGMQMGFIPILASVKPQAEATYCVQVDSPPEGEKVIIDEQNWIELEKKRGSGRNEDSESNHNKSVTKTAR